MFYNALIFKNSCIFYTTCITLSPLGEHIFAPHTHFNLKPIMSSFSLSKQDYIRAAERLDIEPAVLMAVVEVECSSRGGFLSSGRPRILFEGHIFWRKLREQGISPEELEPVHPDIVYPRWVRTHYRGGEGEWERFERAAKISRSAAIESASWGLFQIMGFHYRTCGASSAEEFMALMSSDEATQMSLALTFMQKTGLVRWLKTKDWINFAKRYNGSGYAANRYDKRLAAAYDKFSRQRE